MTYLNNNNSVLSVIKNSQAVTLSTVSNVLGVASNNSFFFSNGNSFPFCNNSVMINMISVLGDGDANSALGKITIDNNKCITNSVGTTFSPQGSTLSNNCSGLVLGNGLMSNIQYSVNDAGDQSPTGFFNNVNIMLKD